MNKFKEGDLVEAYWRDKIASYRNGKTQRCFKKKPIVIYCIILKAYILTFSFNQMTSQALLICLAVDQELIASYVLMSKHILNLFTRPLLFCRTCVIKMDCLMPKGLQ